MGKFITLLVLLGFLSLYFWWIVGAFIVVGLVYFWRAVWQELQLAKEAEAKRQAAIIARCEQQHAWVMAGDGRGTYGEPTCRTN